MSGSSGFCFDSSNKQFRQRLFLFFFFFLLVRLVLLSPRAAGGLVVTCPLAATVRCASPRRRTMPSRLTSWPFTARPTACALPSTRRNGGAPSTVREVPLAISPSTTTLSLASQTLIQLASANLNARCTCPSGLIGAAAATAVPVGAGALPPSVRSGTGARGSVPTGVASGCVAAASGCVLERGRLTSHHTTPASASATTAIRAGSSRREDSGPCPARGIRVRSGVLAAVVPEYSDCRSAPDSPTRSA